MEEKHAKAGEASDFRQPIYDFTLFDTCVVLRTIETVGPHECDIQVDCRERSLDFLKHDHLYTTLQSKPQLRFIDVILGDGEYDVVDHIIRDKLQNVPQCFIIRFSKSPAKQVKVFVKGRDKEVKTLHIDITAEQITDEQVFEILYNAIRLDNVDYFFRLCQPYRHGLTINNPGFRRKLPDILPKAYDVLRLRNVLPVFPITGLAIENILIGFQFFDTDCDEESRKDVRSSLAEVKNRISIVCNLVDKLKDCSGREIDKEFLLVARWIAVNIHVLKRQLKSTYGVIPWEEMEFCLANFICCQTKYQPFQLVYKLVLDKEKLLKYLCYFAKELGEKLPVLTEKDLNSKLPKQDTKATSTFAELRRDFYLLKNVYSLKRIESYIQVAMDVNLDEKPEMGKLVIERTLQVMGECLKNTLESPNVSDDVHAMLLHSAPEHVREIITMLRDSLSHFHTLTKKIEFEGDNLNFFRQIKDDLRKITVSITEILYMMNLDATIIFLNKVIDAHDLAQVSTLFDGLRIRDSGVIKFEDLQIKEMATIKRLVNELQNEIKDQTDYEKSVFDKVQEILKSNEDRHHTVKSRFLQGRDAIAEVDLRQLCHSAKLQSIQKICRDHVTLLQFESPHETLKHVKSWVLKIQNSLRERLPVSGCEHIYELIDSIIWTIEYQAGLIKAIGELKYILEAKGIPKDDAEKEVNIILDAFAEDLERTEKETFQKALQTKKELHYAKKEVVQYVRMKSRVQSVGDIEEMDFPKAAVDKLGLKAKHVELLKHDWEKSEQIVKRVDDSYGNLIKEMEVLQSSFSATAIRKALETFFKSIKLPGYVGHAQNLAKKYTNRLQCYYDKRLDMLVNMLPLPSGDLIRLQQMYLYDKCLQAAVEMLLLDLLEILEIAGLLSDNRLFVEGYSPILLGKSLRNYLAHGDALIDMLVLHPPISIVCNAVMFIKEGRGLLTRENTLVGKRRVADAELSSHIDEMLDIVVKEKQMFSAIKTGQLKVAKQYINGDIVDIKARDTNECTALHFAAQTQDVDVLQYFLDKGLNIACIDIDGRNALHVAAEFGNIDVVRYILENKQLDVNSVDNIERSALHCAAQNGHAEVVVELLANKAQINCLAINRTTPISFAAQDGHGNVVKLLMAVKGCDVNAGNRTNETPLHFAARSGHSVVVNVLSMKAKIDVVNDDGLTPLHMASQYGHKDVVNVLLEKGANVNVQTFNRRTLMTPLHYAAKYGHSDIVEVLHKLTDVRVTSEKEVTPLLLAAMHGHTDVVKYLMKFAPKFDSSNRFHATPLHVAAVQGHMEVVETLLENTDGAIGLKEELLHMAAENGHTAVVEALLCKSVEVDVVDEFGETSLHLASKKGHAGVVATLLDNGASVNATAYEHVTALHYAVDNGRKDVVELLLKNKADVNAQLMNQMTALHVAASKGHTDIVASLLNHNADVYATEEHGWTPLHEAVKNDRRSVVDFLLTRVEVDVLGYNGRTPLHVAVSNGYKEIVKVLLKKGANINALAQDDIAPIYLAANAGCTDVVEILLQKGARTDIKTKSNDTALHLAAMLGHKLIVALLLENGVNVNSLGMHDFTPLHRAAQFGHKDVIEVLLKQETINVNASDDTGLKALHCAALNNHKEIVETLLRKGADVNACNEGGITALHLAAKYGHTEMVEVLLRHGANV